MCGLELFKNPRTTKFSGDSSPHINIQYRRSSKIKFGVFVCFVPIFLLSNLTTASALLNDIYSSYVLNCRVTDKLYYTGFSATSSLNTVLELCLMTCTSSTQSYFVSSWYQATICELSVLQCNFSFRLGTYNRTLIIQTLIF